MEEAALFKVTYGMYIVASRDGDNFNGLIINTATQVTAKPPFISIFISRNSLTHEHIMKSGVFSISILKKDTPLKFIGKWGFKSGRELDKFQDTKFKVGASGAPIVLDHALGYLEVRLKDHFDVGTHTIFIGEVVGTELLEEGEPLTYSHYRDVKGGRSSQNAPTYDGWADKVKERMRYRCTSCHYIYDPASGDKFPGIAPGTPFSGLPERWCCPACGTGKEGFKEAE
ncbi:MAG: flavin reductase [Candidatus Thermoplasmatota archaeon]|jgi:flavin reductase (DIM6/NTAB) family NADH-FMN oxidoreductase RutF/rubredoxin|nr:flavin reductase [Candidatus Thermoplasmatota archaeon]